MHGKALAWLFSSASLTGTSAPRLREATTVSDVRPQSLCLRLCVPVSSVAHVRGGGVGVGRLPQGRWGPAGGLTSHAAPPWGQARVSLPEDAQ